MPIGACATAPAPDVITSFVSSAAPPCLIMRTARARGDDEPRDEASAPLRSARTSSSEPMIKQTAPSPETTRITRSIRS
jgi:hypothetical protein